MVNRLQDEIKQATPLRPTAEAFLSILRTAAVLEHQLGETLKPYGITVTQYNVLRILRGARPDGLCGREVAERLVAQVPDVPRLLLRLETQGLIERERDPSDRRHITARITSEGLRLLARATPDAAVVERVRMGSLNPEAISALIDGLAAVRANQ